MHRLGKLLNSSIGQKSIMALTGLALVGFLIAHLAGNLLIFVGDQTFNDYALALESNKALLYTAEVGLGAVFLVHIALALRISLQNREAKAQRYAIRASMGKKTPGSSSMLVTGAIIAVFLVIHLMDFRLSPDKDAGSLAEMVRARLTTPAGIAIYLVGIVAVGLHLSHAVRSALQTLGVNHPKYNPALRWAGLGLSLVLSLGFASFPVLLGPPAEAETAAGVPHSLEPRERPLFPALEGDAVAPAGSPTDGDSSR